MRFFITLILFLFLGCAVRDDEKAREQLETISKDDLAAIIEDIDTAHLIDNPSYTIESLDYYEKSLYSYNAVVNFYFLSDESFRIERKFRYNTKLKKWERYYNEYKTISK